MCLLHILPIKILPRSSQRQGLHSTKKVSGNFTMGSSHSTSEETKAQVHTTLEERQGMQAERRQSPASSSALLPPGKSQQKHRHACALQTPRAVSRIPAQLMLPRSISLSTTTNHLPSNSSTCSCGAEGNRTYAQWTSAPELPLKQVSPAPFVKGERAPSSPKV